MISINGSHAQATTFRRGRSAHESAAGWADRGADGDLFIDKAF
jgi:hypothetical protein